MKRENSYCFFQNRDCEYFPCHAGADSEEFNCMFCYCPLYVIEDCGGTFTYSSKGYKDCTDCLLPHEPQGYDYVNDRFKLIAEVEKKNRSAGKGACTE